MPGPLQQTSLIFPSAEAISRFKQESLCQDFYIDRDALAVVGYFTEEQISLAIKKYEATWDQLEG